MTTASNTSTPQGVTRYRKKPVTVDTIRWTGTNLPAIRAFAGDDNVMCPAGGDLEVWNDQESAWIPCPLGHSVVKGRLGEFYPISPAVITETYEPADGDQVTVSREDLARAEASEVARLKAELSRVQSAAQTLGKVITRLAQSMEAARIEMIQNGPEAAMQWILNSLPDVSDEAPGDQWDGKETATQWIDRTQAADRAAAGDPR